MSIFRKSALEKLSSPEQLDRMIVTVSPSFFVVAIAAFLIALSVIGWGLFGVIPDAIAVDGVFIQGSEGTFVSFVPLSSGKSLESGMDVIISTADGSINGEVVSVEPYVSTLEDMQRLLGNDMLVQSYASRGPSVAVEIKAEKAAPAGTFARASIIRARRSPISMVL